MVVKGQRGARMKGGGVDTCEVQDRTPSCSLHKPHHILLQLSRGALEGGEVRSFCSDYAQTGTGFPRFLSFFFLSLFLSQLNSHQWASSTKRRHAVAGVVFSRRVKAPLIYHELFGCYVPSLWTLRTVRTDCSCIYQQLTGAVNRHV